MRSYESTRGQPEHKLHFVGKRPRFLEEKVDAPFGRMTAKQGRDPCLKFQPVLYRCDLDSDSGAKARLAFSQASVGGGPKLDDVGMFCVFSLREGISSAEE